MSTYYLSTGGSDSGDGSLANPWQTLNKAKSALQRGDLLCLQGGSQFNGALMLKVPVSVQSYGGARAVINANGAGAAIQTVNDGDPVEAVTFRGLCLTGAVQDVAGINWGAGLDVQGPHNGLLVETVESFGNTGMGLALNGSDGETDNSGNVLGPYSFLHPVVRNCYFHDNPGTNNALSQAGNGCGMSMNGGMYGLFENVIVENNGRQGYTTYGFGIGYSKGNRLVNCQVQGHYRASGSGDGEAYQFDVRTFGNHLFRCFARNIAISGASVYGATWPNHSDYNVIEDCIFIDCCRDAPNDPGAGDINVSWDGQPPQAVVGNAVIGNTAFRTTGVRATLTLAKGTMQHGNTLG